MNPINKENNASYNMVAPSIDDDAEKKVEVVFPTSEVVTPQISANAADVAVRREKTIVKLGTLSAGTTLNLTPEPKNLNVGATVAVNWKSDGTARAITVKVGTDTVATLAGTASTEVTKQLMWDGEGFLSM